MCVAAKMKDILLNSKLCWYSNVIIMTLTEKYVNWRLVGIGNKVLKENCWKNV